MADKRSDAVSGSSGDVVHRYERVVVLNNATNVSKLNTHIMASTSLLSSAICQHRTVHGQYQYVPEASIKSQLKGLMGRCNSERVMVRSDPFTMADTVLDFGKMLVCIGICEGSRAPPPRRHEQEPPSFYRGMIQSQFKRLVH